MTKVKERKKTTLTNPINPDYLPFQDEENTVHFILTDRSGPRPTDPNEEWRPARKLSKMTPEEFVNCFAPQYTANDAFVFVNTPAVIYSIAKHIDEIVFIDRYYSRYEGFGQTLKGRDLRERVKKEVENLKTIYVTNQQFIASYKDILWIPQDGTEDLDQLINHLPEYI